MNKDICQKSETVKLNLKWVTDIIGDDYWKKWKHGDIVKIKAQTGTGKTHFILHGLITNMWDNEKMLILCNRIKLKRQLKKELCDKFNIHIPQDIKELDKKEKFNNVYVMSYQTLNERLLNEEYLGEDLYMGYDYIICDEIHYIMADSFTGKTENIWKELIKGGFHQTIRVFISATMEDIVATIDKCFNKNQEGAWGSCIRNAHEYDTGRDYSYLKPYCFDDINTILELIEKDNSDDKWLIFVSSKEDGEYMKNYLLNKNITSEFLFSGKKFSNEELSIMNESKFKCKVLISTSVLDNGVNIYDEQVKHLVVMAWDETTFIQEIGRLRFNELENVPIINLYLRTRKKFIWQCKLNTENNKLKVYDLFKNDIETFKRKYNTTGMPNGFYLDKDNNWKYDIITYANILKRIGYIENIIKDAEDHGKYSFMMKQLELLGLDNDDNLSDERNLEIQKKNKFKDELKNYLESHLGEVYLKKEDRKELIEMIGLIDKKHSNLSNNNIKYIQNIKTLNEYLLNEIKSNFIIKKFETSRMINGKEKKYKAAWKIIRN